MENGNQEFVESVTRFYDLIEQPSQKVLPGKYGMWWPENDPHFPEGQQFRDSPAFGALRRCFRNQSEIGTYLYGDLLRLFGFDLPPLSRVELPETIKTYGFQLPDGTPALFSATAGKGIRFHFLMPYTPKSTRLAFLEAFEDYSWQWARVIMERGIPLDEDSGVVGWFSRTSEVISAAGNEVEGLGVLIF